MPYTSSEVGWPTAAWRNWAATPRAPHGPNAKDPGVADRPGGAGDPPAIFGH